MLWLSSRQVLPKILNPLEKEKYLYTPLNILLECSSFTQQNVSAQSRDADPEHAHTAGQVAKAQWAVPGAGPWLSLYAAGARQAWLLTISDNEFVIVA